MIGYVYRAEFERVLVVTSNKRYFYGLIKEVVDPDLKFALEQLKTAQKAGAAGEPMIKVEFEVLTKGVEAYFHIGDGEVRSMKRVRNLAFAPSKFERAPTPTLQSFAVTAPSKDVVLNGEFYRVESNCALINGRDGRCYYCRSHNVRPAGSVEDFKRLTKVEPVSVTFRASESEGPNLKFGGVLHYAATSVLVVSKSIPLSDTPTPDPSVSSSTRTPQDSGPLSLQAANTPASIPMVFDGNQLIGRWLDCEVRRPEGKNYLVTAPEIFPGWTGLFAPRKHTHKSMLGQSLPLWVFGADSVRRTLWLSDDDFGRVPCSERTLHRYRDALAAVLRALEDGCVADEKPDGFSEVKGMFNRTVLRDQGDWFIVWEALDRPDAAEARSVAEDLGAVARCLRRNEPVEIAQRALFRHEPSLRQRLTHALNELPIVRTLTESEFDDSLPELKNFRTKLSQGQLPGTSCDETGIKDGPRCSGSCEGTLGVCLARVWDRLRQWIPEAPAAVAYMAYVSVASCPMLVTTELAIVKAYQEAVKGTQLVLLHSSNAWLDFDELWKNGLKTAWLSASSNPETFVLVVLESVNLSLSHLWVRPLVNIEIGFSDRVHQEAELGWPSNLRIVFHLNTESSLFTVANGIFRSSGAILLEESMLLEKTIDFDVPECYSYPLPRLDPPNETPGEHGCTVSPPHHKGAARDIARLRESACFIGMDEDVADQVALSVRVEKPAKLQAVYGGCASSR